MGIGSLVGLDRGTAEGRERAHRLAALADLPWKSPLIGLHPFRGVVPGATLPRAEPEQDQSELLLAGLTEQLIDIAEVELSYARLYLLPRDRHFHGVGVQVAGDLPDPRQRDDVVARVGDLSTQDDEWPSVDQQHVTAVLLREARDGNVLSPRRTGKHGRAKGSAYDRLHVHPPHLPH